MKILVIHHSDLIGGGTISAFDIIKSIDTMYNVKLVLPLEKHYASDKAKENGITISDFGLIPPLFGYYNGGRNIIYTILQYYKRKRNFAKLTQILSNEKPDLVILNSIVLFPIIKHLKRKNINNIIFIRETMRGSLNNPINKIISRSLNLTNGVSFLSEYDKTQWNLKNPNQVVIPDMVNITNLSLENQKSTKFENILNLYDENNFYLLYLGGNSKIKGPKTVLKMMLYLEKLGYNNIKLLFVGLKDVNEFSQSKYKNIYFFETKKDITSFYMMSDIVLFPATKAHQSRAIYESGMFKKPIIATNFDNYKEYLKENVNGLFFKKNNYKDLSKQVLSLYRDKQLCLKLGENNYNLAISNHEQEKISHILNNFINKTFNQS